MKMPPLLLGATLLLWGWASTQWAVAVVLALLMIGLPLLAQSHALIRLDEADRNRVVDLCSVVTGAVFAYFLVTQGVPAGLLAAVGWLPATLAPLLLAQGAGGGFRAGNLSYSLRRSARPAAQRVVDLGAPYFALLLLASATIATRSVVFFVLLCVLVACGLFVATTGAVSRRPFVVAIALAFPSAFMLSEGIHGLQGLLEDVVAPYFVGSATDPFKSQTRMGDLGRIKLSDSIVWRLDAQPSPFFSLRLRDGVYSRFDGKTWLARPDAFRPLAAAGGSWVLGNAQDVAPNQMLHVGLIGRSSGGRSMLPLPLGALRVDGDIGQAMASRTLVVKLEEVPSLLRAGIGYAPTQMQVESVSDSDLALSKTDTEMLNRLGVLSPEVGRTALGTLPARQRVLAMEAFFEKNFRYTLFLGNDASDTKSVERFLLKDRSGHCEYFATATVLLLRYLGVPARYVTGYSAHEYSPLEGSFVVRRRDAHAWAEALVDSRWVEVDTTPSTWVGAEESQAPVWQPLVDFASWAWYGLQNWASNGRVPVWLAWLLGAVLLVVGARAAWRRRQRTRPASRVAATPSVRDAYTDFESAMQKRGFLRAPGETPRAWLTRLRREGCAALDEPSYTDADQRVADCYRRRYSGV